MYVLTVLGQPVARDLLWRVVADEALKRGFAVLACNTLFTLCPGVMIRRV